MSTGHKGSIKLHQQSVFVCFCMVAYKLSVLFTYIIIVFNLFCCCQLLVNKDYH